MKGVLYNAPCCQARKDFFMNSINGFKKEQYTYTADEIREILNCSEHYVYDLCKQAEAEKLFRVIRTGRRFVRVHKQSFDRWFDGAFAEDSPAG